MILHRGLDSVMPPYRELFKRYDLTEQQWRVLRVLWSSERVTSAEVAERALLLQPSLVGIIDRLEKKGLVNRVRSVTDRRVVYVVASAKGRALQQKVLPEVELIHERMRSAVSDEAWSALQETLDRISEAMSQNDQDDAVNA